MDLSHAKTVAKCVRGAWQAWFDIFGIIQMWQRTILWIIVPRWCLTPAWLCKQSSVNWVTAENWMKLNLIQARDLITNFLMSDWTRPSLTRGNCKLIRIMISIEAFYCRRILKILILITKYGFKHANRRNIYFHNICNLYQYSLGSMFADVRNDKTILTGECCHSFCSLG